MKKMPVECLRCGGKVFTWETKNVRLPPNMVKCVKCGNIIITDGQKDTHNR